MKQEQQGYRRAKNLQESMCSQMLAAIELGYQVSFDESTLRDYFTGKTPIPEDVLPAFKCEAGRIINLIFDHDRCIEVMDITDRLEKELLTDCA